LSGDSGVSIRHSNAGCEGDDNECLDDGGDLENEGDDSDDDDDSRFERYDLYD